MLACFSPPVCNICEEPVSSFWVHEYTKIHAHFVIISKALVGVKAFCAKFYEKISRKLLAVNRFGHIAKSALQDIRKEDLQGKGNGYIKNILYVIISLQILIRLKNLVYIILL